VLLRPLDDVARSLGSGVLFATIECGIGLETWPYRAGARRDIEYWITRYNERRLHSALKYQTPTETRRAWQIA
jgi:putative transposase